MAHQAQIDFCLKVKSKHPNKFKGSVIDVGSMDINGNNRYLFEDCTYLGIDIGEGPNVDIVAINGAHACKPLKKYDVVISTECLEHDRHYKSTLQAMIDWLTPGGLMLFTCATTGRPEHGTNKTRPKSSPYTNDYYKNLTPDDIREAIDLSVFSEYEITTNKTAHDLYFYGIKKELTNVK